MHRSITFLVAILAACALAAPMPKKALSKRYGSFTVPSKGRQNLHRNSRNEIARAYRKYGWEIVIVNPSTGEEWNPFAPEPSSTSAAPVEATSTASSSEAAASGASSMGGSTTVVASPAATSAAAGSDNGDGEVAANPETNESEYLSPVSIGGQTLMLDFDTGSADLWVFSTDLPSDEIGEHTAFNPSKSSTFSEYEGGSWQIAYGDGSGASGSVGFDTVKIGDLTVAKQAVELADQVSKSFISDENNDGLVGLAFSAINTVQPQQQKTFFENIMDELDQPLFTADLEDDASGTYEFGTIDKSKYTGDLHFTTIDNSNGFWQFDSTSYSIGGKTVQNSGASPAIADTGTSLVLVDDEVAQAYYAQIDGSTISSTAGGYVYPCDANVPSFGVEIGNSGYTAEITGADMTFAKVNSNTCFGGLQSNGGGGLQIFGDVLLKQYFAVFDAGNMSFGIAPKSAAVNTKSKRSKALV